MNHRPAYIFFVEDRPEHIFLAHEALRKEKIENDVQFFRTAEDCIFQMQKQGIVPDLIFIDLNLENGKMQGEQFAYYLLEHNLYNATEICIMSASYVTREKENQYAKTRIKFFLKKPLITEQIDEVVRSSKRLKKLIIVKEDAEQAA